MRRSRPIPALLAILALALAACTKPGTCEIACELHPSMQMTITVEG